MTAAIAAVAAAVTAVAGLLLYLFKTQWSARARWEKELKRLEAEYDKTQEAYHAEVAVGGPDPVRLYALYRLSATNLANHRAAGQRAGFLDRAE